MVFSGQIYNQVKDYLHSYLFGFDKSQLQCSLLDGAINLENCNLKPNKAQKFLNDLGIPFSLKAGMIGKLELKLNLLSGAMKWISANDSQNIDIRMHNVNFIFGPCMKNNSKNDSFLEENEQELLEPYEDNNCFNIFTNNLKLRKRPQLNRKQSKKNVSTMPKEVRDLYKSVQLQINKLHIRYEDDYFNSGSPYAWGIVIDHLKCETTNLKQLLDQLSQFKPTSFNLDQYQRQMGHDKSGLATLIKDFQIKGLKVYWNCLSEMFVPTSLWESTINLKYQIFEALDTQQLTEMMQQVFDQKHKDSYSNIIEKCDLSSQIYYVESEVTDSITPSNFFETDEKKAADIYKALQLHVTCSGVKFNVNPQILNDIVHFIDLLQMQSLLKDLKQYRPHRRPITNVADKYTNRFQLKRKRKLIVRDWFFFVVWAIRLKKIFNNIYQRDAPNNFLFFNPKYANLVQNLLVDPLMTSQQLRKHIEEQRKEDKTQKQMELKFRLESVNLSVFKDHLFSVKHRACPDFEVKASMISVDIITNETLKDDETQVFKCKVETFVVSSYHEHQVKTLQQPKELRPMKFHHNVEVQNAVVVVPPQSAGLHKSSHLQSQPISRQTSLQVQQAQRRIPLPKRPNNILGSINTVNQRSQANNMYLETEPDTDFDSVAQHHLPNITSPGRLMIERMKCVGVVGLQGMQKNFLEETMEKSLSESQFLNSGLQDDTPISFRKKVKNSNDVMQEQKVMKRNPSKDSLMRTVVDSVISFTNTNILGAGILPTKQKQVEQPDTYGTQLQKQGFITQRQNRPPIYSQGMDKKSALERVRSSPSVNNFSLQNYPMPKSDRPDSTQLDDIQQFSLNYQKSKAKHLDSKIQGKALIFNQRSIPSKVCFSDRHKFVQSQLIDDNNNEYNGILGTGSDGVDIDEPEVKSRNRSVARVGTGINEGIRNKNCVQELNSENKRKEGGNVLGQLLGNRDKNNAYSSVRQNASISNRLSRQSSFADLSQAKHTAQATEIQSKQQTVNDRTTNTLPFQIVKQTEQKQSMTLQMSKQQLLTITKQKESCVEVSHHLTLSSKHNKVVSQTSMGSLQVTYSTASLQSLFQLLIEVKTASAFRDFDFVKEGSPLKWFCENLDKKQQKPDFTIQHHKVNKQTESHILTFAKPVSRDQADKIALVNKELKNMDIDFKFNAERVYVSFFEQESRNQICKFASPPLNLSFYKDREETGFEIFGFQYQQTSDLASLQLFTNNLYTQFELLSKHPAIQKGTSFYDKILREHKEKEDQKLFKNLLTIAKLNKQPRIATHLSPKAILESKQTVKKHTNDFQFQQFKKQSKPVQQKPKGKQVKSPTKFSMVSSTLMLEEMPCKKGDHFEDVIPDNFTGESETEMHDTEPGLKETEPALRGDSSVQDYSNSSPKAHRSVSAQNDTPLLQGKPRQSMATNQLANFSNKVDGFSLCITQITVPGDGHVQFCQQPGMIYMNFDKEGEKKLPQKPNTINNVRPVSQKKGMKTVNTNLFKKAVQIKQQQERSSHLKKRQKTEQEDDDPFSQAPFGFEERARDESNDASNYRSSDNIKGNQNQQQHKFHPKQQTPPQFKIDCSPRKKLHQTVISKQQQNILTQSQDLSQSVVNKNRMDNYY